MTLSIGWSVQFRGTPTGVKGHRGAVMCVAFLARDRLLSAGGAGDGSVRLWDWRQAEPLVASKLPDEQYRLSKEGKAVIVNCMASTPEGTFVVIGREDGRLERYDTEDLGNQFLLNPGEFRKLLAVEALALGGDGRTLAAITLAHKPTRDVLPRTECDVTVRTLPDGGDVRKVRTTGDVSRAARLQPRWSIPGYREGLAAEVAAVPM